MYLLDTNVISELRKTGTRLADQHVVSWARRTDPMHHHLSVVTLFELESGILRIDRRDPKQGRSLRAWLSHQVLPSFADRILPVDLPIALRCATLHVPNPRPWRDSFIAATALEHSFTVVTRNVADFQPMGVACLNPWHP